MSWPPRWSRTGAQRSLPVTKNDSSYLQVESDADARWELDLIAAEQKQVEATYREDAKEEAKRDQARRGLPSRPDPREEPE